MEKKIDFLKRAQEEAALRTDTFVAIIDEAIKNANSSKKKIPVKILFVACGNSFL